MTDERTVEDYRGYKLVAALIDGEYKGKGSIQRVSKSVATSVGELSNDVLPNTRVMRSNPDYQPGKPCG